MCQINILAISVIYLSVYILFYASIVESDMAKSVTV